LASRPGKADQKGAARRTGFNTDIGIVTAGYSVAYGQAQSGALIFGSKKGCSQAMGDNSAIFIDSAPIA
jgi:hypothetical protein